MQILVLSTTERGAIVARRTLKELEKWQDDNFEELRCGYDVVSLNLDEE